MIMTALIPIQYRILAVIVLAGACMAFGWVRGASHVQVEWDTANTVRVEAERRALLAREHDNAELRATQAAINNAITLGKDNEITRLTARVEHLGWLRVGTAICGGSAASTEAASTASGDSADSPGRLVRDDVDRDFKALIVAVETDLATGRACQSFVKENGLQPPTKEILSILRARNAAIPAPDGAQGQSEP